jgi:hypothetical protein
LFNPYLFSKLWVISHRLHKLFLLLTFCGHR